MSTKCLRKMLYKMCALRDLSLVLPSPNPSRNRKKAHINAMGELLPLLHCNTVGIPEERVTSNNATEYVLLVE